METTTDSLLAWTSLAVLAWLVAAIFHHSNLRLAAGLERTLARLVITPSTHWVHHHARRSATRRSPGMPIGVETCGEQSLPRLLLRPFVSETPRPRI